jgi:hypothetical protein
MTENEKRELDLIEIQDPGPCALCGKRETTTWCKSCTPPHYVCPGCSESHRTS